MKSGTVFRQLRDGSEVDALSQVTIHSTSAGSDWDGLQIEVGSNHGWQVDDVMVDGHFVGINLADTELYLQTRGQTKWTSKQMPHRTLWINPEGRPFSLYHSQNSHWASCLIAGRFLDEVKGGHHELVAGYGIVDPPLAHLFLTIIALLQEAPERSRSLAPEVIRSFVRGLAARHGREAPEPRLMGGIPPARLQSLLKWIETNPGRPLTVAAMAAELGLSAAHFSRQFKRSTGVTPWNFVVNARLDAAMTLLQTGASVTAAASEAGFADQPHLSRLFKRRFGIAPASIVRT